MRVGFYQFAPFYGETSANLNKIIAALQGAQADLIVLPELPFTGYLFADRAELAALAEDPRSSPTVEALTELCRTSGFHLVTGFAEKAGDKIFNSALMLGPSGLIATYRKLHLFDREKLYFDPGDLPLQVTPLAGVKIGMMVCFDWIFPEVCRTLALLGTDLVCHPANLVLNYCQQAMVTRCLENGLFAITANRCGAENRPFASLQFTGQSQITAPRGELLYLAPAAEDILYITEIEVAKARDKRITERNDLIADRRPEWYAK